MSRWTSEDLDKIIDLSQKYEPKQTKFDRIHSMTIEELAEWLANMYSFLDADDEPYKSIYNIDTEKEEIVHDSYGSIMEWLQSEVEG